MFSWLSRKVENKVIIKAFVGAQGSGKDYKCNLLENNEGYIKIAFADALRDIVWDILQWEPETNEQYDKFKKGAQRIGNYGKVNGRHLLQGLGSLMREIDQDFWIKQFKLRLDKLIAMGYDRICVSDARYINEINAIFEYKNKADVKIEFCDYKSERYNDKDIHESEQLAQKLLKLGFKDGQEISESDIKSIDSFTRI